MASWYYVDGKDRIGPVSEEDLLSLVGNKLNEDSYVWRKGFSDWMKIRDVEELDLTPVPQTPPPRVQPPVAKQSGIDWKNIDRNQRLFHIRIGADRGVESADYGPYTLNELKKAMDQNRINGKTLIYMPGMTNWTFLAEIPIYQQVFQSMPPVIDESEKRKSIRRPFVAKLFFHDNNKLYEGICRDISVGGMQILVADFPAKVGQTVTLNVHPNNDEHQFTAQGEIVRQLPGNQGFSLRFTGLKDDAMRSISDYIAKQ